mgnify:CR=1 FL=1
MDKKFRIREGIDRRELFGNLDFNLDYIREVTSADIIQRDDELIIKAESEEAIDKASRILDELMSAIDKRFNTSFHSAKRGFLTRRAG